MLARPLSFVVLASILGCASGTDQPTRTATAATTAAPTPLPPGVAELVSGTSIGPVRIGMTRAELDGLGLPTKKGAMPNEVQVGPYIAMLDGDRVAGVHVTLADLPAGARVGGTVFVAAGGTKIETIAPKLPGCGPVRMNTGANVILCDGGKTELVAGGPPGIVALQVNSPARAAELVAKDRASYGPPEATWKHPGMAMTFSYPVELLKVSQKPDGATLESENLGKIEDRSGANKDVPQPLRITISVRVGKLAKVLASEHLDEKACESGTMAGHVGCRVSRGSHEAQQELTFAPVGDDKTLQVTCEYLGDAAKPKVSFEEQRKACQRVVSTLQYKP